MKTMNDVQQIRLPKDEKLIIQAAAKASGLTVSAYFRAKTIQAARADVGAMIVLNDEQAAAAVNSLRRSA